MKTGGHAGEEGAMFIIRKDTWYFFLIALGQILWINNTLVRVELKTDNLEAYIFKIYETCVCKNFNMFFLTIP